MKMTELIISELVKMSDVDAAVANALQTNETFLQMQNDLTSLLERMALAESDIISARADLTTHKEDGQIRWQAITDSLVDLKAQLIAEAYKIAADVYEGIEPTYDMTKPTVIIGNNGLIDLASQTSYTCVANGAIICGCNAILGVAKVITITYLAGGSTTWTSPLSVLGLPVGGDANPSNPMQVSTGDVISVSGVLSLGETLNVTFYPNALPQ